MKSMQRQSVTARSGLSWKRSSKVQLRKVSRTGPPTPKTFASRHPEKLQDSIFKACRDHLGLEVSEIQASLALECYDLEFLNGNMSLLTELMPYPGAVYKR